MDNTIYIDAIGFSAKEESQLEVNLKKISDSFAFLKKNQSVAPRNTVIFYNIEFSYDISDFGSKPVVLFTGQDKKISEIRDYLLLNIVDILEEMPNKERCEALWEKMLFHLLFPKNVPLKALEHITKSSIEVRSHNQLMKYIFDYFHFFNNVEVVSFFLQERDRFEFLYGEDVDGLKGFIGTIELDEKFVGNYYSFSDMILIPVNRDRLNYSWICLKTPQNIQDILIDLLFIHLERIGLYRNLQDVNTDLVALSMTDEVTGLFNQRRLYSDLKEEIENCEEQNMNFSLLFVDIDHFKKVNDSFGHIVGSSMLKQLGEVLTDLVRSTDSIYRYGGDEFIVLMRFTKTEVVYSVASRILDKDATKFVIDDDTRHRLSVSIGIAEYPKDASTAEEIVNFADKMMYKSKDSGRGKVFHIKEVSA